jgi:hypothetical protein
MRFYSPGSAKAILQYRASYPLTAGFRRPILSETDVGGVVPCDGLLRAADQLPHATTSSLPPGRPCWPWVLEGRRFAVDPQKRFHGRGSAKAISWQLLMPPRTHPTFKVVKVTTPSERLRNEVPTALRGLHTCSTHKASCKQQTNVFSNNSVKRQQYSAVPLLRFTFTDPQKRFYGCCTC